MSSDRDCLSRPGRCSRYRIRALDIGSVNLLRVDRRHVRCCLVRLYVAILRCTRSYSRHDASKPRERLRGNRLRRLGHRRTSEFCRSSTWLSSRSTGCDRAVTGPRSTSRKVRSELRPRGMRLGMAQTIRSADDRSRETPCRSCDPMRHGLACQRCSICCANARSQPMRCTDVPPNHCMQPTPQPVIKFACANLSPVWRAADAGC